MAQKKAAGKRRAVARAAKGQKREAVSCGLCGQNTKELTRTQCCGEWICDDESEYVIFSYAHNSCHRNHSRYTLCASHDNEGHAGAWPECQECREGFETEMYVWYGTNEYNFVKLTNPPTYKPTKCAKCKRVIKLAEDGYSMKGGKYYCDRCTGFDLSQLLG
jgi:hypothetical protein